MGKYLKEFENHTAYEAAKSSLILPNVSLCMSENEVHYNPLVPVTGVSLNKSELSLNKGDTETLVATVLPNDASNKGVTWSSSDNSVATVSSNGLVTAIGGGNTNIIATTVNGGYTAQCKTEVIYDPYAGHEYVDLDLPSGIKWATMNIGASDETDYGLYFQWGDTQGYTASEVGTGSGQKAFQWEDYKYCNGTSNPGETGMTKYNSTDGKTVLEVSDDAARANWGGSWRMPTETEFNELLNNTNKQWTSIGGVNGYKFTNKNDSTKYVFFPAAGHFYDGGVHDVDSKGLYWSSSLNTSSMICGRLLYFNNYNCKTNYYVRYGGRVVRGVVDE